MKLEHGWLTGVRQVPSPHCNERPHNEAPSLLVIHNISLPPGEYGGPWIDKLFTGTLPSDAQAYRSLKGGKTATTFPSVSSWKEQTLSPIPKRNTTRCIRSRKFCYSTIR
jgi:hypothetical protein